MIGVEAAQLDDFGVNLVKGRAYEAAADDEILLGYRAAADLDKDVGDTLLIGEDPYTVVGLFSTGEVFGDSASMRPLPALQADERKPGAMTLLFVRTRVGTDVDVLRAAIEADSPQMVTVRTQSEFGRVDRNLQLINAANLGGSILALVIGAIGVMNTTLLSFFERTRELGLLRALGWSSRRLLALVLGEAFAVSLAGAAVGVALGFAAVEGLARLPDLVGVFNPTFTASVFGRALGFASAMTLLGALYPAARAARLAPLEAMRHE